MIVDRTIVEAAAEHLKGFILTESEIKRFQSHITKRGPDECWEWHRALEWFGYGRMVVRRKWRLKAHRVAFLLNGGNLSEDKPRVLHSCDNPKCCNPQHLRAGSDKENAEDKVSRGRQTKGEQTGPKVTGQRRKNGDPGVSFTPEDVVKIRALYREQGMTQRGIGVIYNVHQTVIGRIVNRRSWAHIP